MLLSILKDKRLQNLKVWNSNYANSKEKEKRETPLWKASECSQPEPGLSFLLTLIQKKIEVYWLFSVFGSNFGITYKNFPPTGVSPSSLRKWLWILCVMVVMHIIDCSTPSSPADKNKNSCRSPHALARNRSRRWRHSRTGTAAVVVAALLVSTTAWLSLVFSGTTVRCWHRLRKWEGSPRTLSGKRLPSITDSFDHRLPIVTPTAQVFSRPHLFQSGRNRSLSEEKHRGNDLSLKHIMFGIAGSSQLWNRRKEFVRLWWRPNDMRGYVWLEEPVAKQDWDDSLPSIMISEDTSRFRYTNPTGHPSGLRISRIISESFRLVSPDVRWFVLGDDDTIFNADNLVAVLSKYDSSEMIYIGAPSESHSANTYFSHSMAYGGGGIAISYPLAEALSNILDDCLERYHILYGSDDRLHACISELGIPLSREQGFHQVCYLIPHINNCWLIYTFYTSNGWFPPPF